MIEQILYALLHHFAPGAHETVKAVKKHGVTNPGAIADDVVHETWHEMLHGFQLGVKIVEYIALGAFVFGALLGGGIASVALVLLNNLLHFLPR